MGLAVCQHSESTQLAFGNMSKLPIQVLEDLFAALDQKDSKSILALLSPDVVMVDEISRTWLRGKEAAARQIQAVLSAADAVRSRLSDVQLQPLGQEAVLVTGWLDQTYILKGDHQTITAPLSACLKHDNAAWIVASLHAIPLMDVKA